MRPNIHLSPGPYIRSRLESSSSLGQVALNSARKMPHHQQPVVLIEQGKISVLSKYVLSNRVTPSHRELRFLETIPTGHTRVAAVIPETGRIVWTDFRNG